MSSYRLLALLSRNEGVNRGKQGEDRRLYKVRRGLKAVGTESRGKDI